MAHKNEVFMVESFRMLVPKNEPTLIVLEIKSRDGTTINFGLAREHFAHTVKVWNFDLNAMAVAVATGTPLPGKPLGQTDAKAN